MKVVFEPRIADHDPALYSSDQVAGNVISGWAGINDEAINRYVESGYLVVANGFTGQEVDEAKRELIDMTLSDSPNCESIYFEGSIRNLEGFQLATVKADGGGNEKEGRQLALGQSANVLPNIPAKERAAYVRKFMGFTKYHPPLKRLADHPELIRLVRRLCHADDLKLFQEMAMIKPPGGREKPWHQDHAYFNYPIETSVVGVWIALGDVDENNGCMFLAPGLHKQGPILHFMRRDWQICDADIYAELAGKRVCAPMKAGDVLIFDSKLPHGTPKNNTNDYRWAVQLHYMATRSTPCSDEDRLALFGSEGKNVTC